MQTDTPTQSYLTPAQAGEYVHLSARALVEYRRRGTGPRYVRLGGPTGRVRYSRAELDRWMAEQTYSSTSAESEARALAS